MKVECLEKKYITSTSPVFFKPYPVPKNEDDFISFNGGTTLEDGNEYSVFVGAEYEVYGIMVHDGVLYYLISYEEFCEPDWIPSSLFKTTDCTLPCFWVIQTTFVNNSDILFIMSHYEVATNFNHMLGLIQGFQSDVEKFNISMLDY